MFNTMSAGHQPDSYDYLEHPLREEIIESFVQGKEEIAVITRNRYGSLILNSASVCFIES
ncbi:MAG: hypothetical protein JW860_00790 [Sedimentisphaerales bacterium]|nr:hypothetical protein [Sedimentisphaerales bacterium]